MAITDLNKLRQDVGFLATASPQQMNTVSQLLQNNQQADPYESLAFLIASNQQREMRTPNPPMPQQTILQQRIAELQTQAPPAMGGIPNVGQNQMALQQAAAQNPNMAGIAAAPENVPGAATGGLVSFAHGGEVRGFEQGGRSFLPDWYTHAHDPEPPLATLSPDTKLTMPVDNPYAMQDIYQREIQPKVASQYEEALKQWNESVGKVKQDKKGASEREYYQTTEPSPSKRAELSGMAGLKALGLFDVPEVTSSDYTIGTTGTPDAYGTPDTASWAAKTQIAKEAKAPGYKTENQRHAHTERKAAGNAGIPAATPAQETSKAEAEKPPLTLDQQLKVYEDALNIDTPAAMELKGQMEKRVAESKKENMLASLAQGIGGMLRAQTPYVGQALGEGLVSGTSAYLSGKSEADRQQQALDALALQPELQKMANRRLAMQHVTELEKAKQAALAKGLEQAREFGYRTKEGEQKHKYDIEKMTYGAGLTKEEIASRSAADKSNEAFRSRLDLDKQTQLRQLESELKQRPNYEMLQNLYSSMQQAQIDPDLIINKMQEALGSFSGMIKNPQAGPTPAQPQRVSSSVLYSPPR